MLSMNGRYIFLDAHLHRLIKGADFLFPGNQWPEQQEALEGFLKINFENNCYYRLSLFDKTILVTKKNHQPKAENIKVGIAESRKVESCLPSYLKSSNYLMSELELRKAKIRGFDEVVFLSKQNFLTEAATSNIFFLMNNNQVWTPPASSMVLEGIMRKKLMDFLTSQMQTSVQEKEISLDDLKMVREIWLCNAISGVRSVSEVEGYFKSTSATFYSKICSMFGRYGELLDE